jgi:hypothetical protein
MSQFPEIFPGQTVLARDQSGTWLPRRAITGVMPGRDFPVVWVCREEKWTDSLADQIHPAVGMPWPAEDVKPV